MHYKHHKVVTIHDPLHGAIDISAKEIKLIDSPFMQRLRYIKQLGFADMAFPGATHSRYAHSIGAMQVATNILDRVLPQLDLSSADSARFRQATRLAVLLHDIGHSAFSHASEHAMPHIEKLSLQAWLGVCDRQARHEDYTLKMIVDSALTQLIEQYMADCGTTPSMLAALVTGVLRPQDVAHFMIAGINYYPLLQQIVSSELDADRMDYLQRDAYYCGVSYGHFDHVWLINNMVAVHPNDSSNSFVLALQHRAVWAFEAFLLSRYHMFLSIYYHHTAVCFNHLLAQYYATTGTMLSGDIDTYLAQDDVSVWADLRASKNPWATKLTQRRAYKLLLEYHTFDPANDQTRFSALEACLQAAEIDYFCVRTWGVLSKYFGKQQTQVPLFVLEKEQQRIHRIDEYTPLYKRFADDVGIVRMYCNKDHVMQAQPCLNKMGFV